MRAFQATPVSAGVAIGPAFRYSPTTLSTAGESVASGAAEEELRRYRDAKRAAVEQLQQLYRTLRAAAPQQAEILLAHQEIVEDEAMDEEICDCIAGEPCTAAFAVERVYGQYAEAIGRAADALLRERAADLLDVRQRLLQILLGTEPPALPERTAPAILVAHDLLPSDTAGLDPQAVLGIVTEVGGQTSHAAILARSLGIPAVAGAAGIVDAVADGAQMVVDAVQGTVLLEADDGTLTQYRQRQQADREARRLQAEYLPTEPVTLDGERVELCLNIGSDRDPGLDFSEYADGVGLFRSEFLYMQSDSLPDEETQYQAYVRVLRRFGGRQVVIRTLDIGGDKALPYLQLPQEENPFLGCRALRFCFTREDLFRTQLRALLRAGTEGNLAILLPMVTGIPDLLRARELLRAVEEELEQAGVPYRRGVPVGIMIEVPAIALQARQAAALADFASIGTNDLCQYLTAADRLNPQAAPYYQPYHPAMMGLIAQVAEAFLAAGKPLSVCGELGGDLPAAAAFLGMGIRKLSMSASSLAAIKRLVRAADCTALAGTARELAELPDASAVRERLQAVVDRILS